MADAAIRGVRHKLKCRGRPRASKIDEGSGAFCERTIQSKSALSSVT